MKHLHYSEMKHLPLVGFTAVLVCIADIAVAKTLAEIDLIAKAVTVKIDLLKAKSVGSGIIVGRQGDLYTIITNRHVVCGTKHNCKIPPSQETYTLELNDAQEYKVSDQSVKLLGKNIDLAMIQFRSNRAYPVALVADPGSFKEGDPVYTSGYPAESPGFYFGAGKAIAVVNKRLIEDRGGYTMIYDAGTQPGMSGGGVFSQEGRLVAIHGQGERWRDNSILSTKSAAHNSLIDQDVDRKIGYNRGIPVRWVVQCLAERDIRLGNYQPVNLVESRAFYYWF
jgi:hypothetical protein